MALSGTIYKNVNSLWRLQLEWSATQNVANNTSTITAKLYWMGLSANSTTYTSATKSGSVTIDGTASAFSGAGLAKLTGAEKKLIKTYSKTVTHNSDGTKSVALNAYFDVELDINGYVGRVSLSGTATLNTIPRASSLTSSASWTAGNALPITISRASTGFLHDITIKVNGVVIKYLYDIATSTTVNFTDTENTNIFKELAKDTTNFNQATTIDVKTKSGSTVIGTKSFTGTCSSPSASTVTSAFDNYVYVDETINFPISRVNSKFTHTIDITIGTFKKTITGVGASTSWTPTTAEQNQIYAQMPNETYKTSTTTITTYFNGVVVRKAVGILLQFYVRNANPIFSESQFSYADTNASIIAITGNASYIVQGKSDLSVSIDSIATGDKSATIVRYDITVGSVTKSLTGVGTVSFGKVNDNVNIPVKVTVVDSRGLSTVKTKTISVLPYSVPRIDFEAKRLNNFENQTTLKLKGSFSPLTIGGVIKNTVGTVRYRYRERLGVWGSWRNFTTSTSGSNYTATDVSISLDNTKSYEFEVSVSDRVATGVATKLVDVGQPIFFIDSVKKSIGVNKFPSKTNSFEVGGTFATTELLIDSGTHPLTMKNSGSSAILQNSNGNVEFYITSGYVDVKTSTSRFYMTKPVTFEQGMNVTGTATVSSVNATNSITAGNSVSTPTVMFDKGGMLKQLNPTFIHARNTDDTAYFNLACEEIYTNTGFQGNGRVTNKNINAIGWHGFAGKTWAQMQRKEFSVATGGASMAYGDFTWDKAFNTVCQSVQATPLDANSASYHVAVYSVTRTGARVYIQNIHKEAHTLSIKVQVLGLGD